MKVCNSDSYEKLESTVKVRTVDKAVFFSLSLFFFFFFFFF